MRNKIHIFLLLIALVLVAGVVVLKNNNVKAQSGSETGPCAGKSAGTCRFDSQTIFANPYNANKLQWMITTDSGQEFIYIFEPNTGWGSYKVEDLTAARNGQFSQANGPCYGKSAGQCRFDSQTIFANPYNANKLQWMITTDSGQEFIYIFEPNTGWGSYKTEDLTAARNGQFGPVYACRDTFTVVTTLTPTPTPPISETPTPTPPISETPTPTPPTTEISCSIYGVRDTTGTGSQFVKIDIDSKIVTAIGQQMAHYNLENLEIDSSGSIYTVSNPEGSSQRILYKIDPSSGAFTLVKNLTTGPDIQGLSFRNGDDSQLWAWVKKGSGLYTIDIATGAVTQQFASTEAIEAIAWDNDGTLLYAVSTYTPASLYTYDPATKAFNMIASNLPKQTDALDMDADGQLLGAYHDGSTLHIFRYDVGSLGIAEDITMNPTPNYNIEGIAVYCGSTPLVAFGEQETVSLGMWEQIVDFFRRLFNR